MPINMRNLLVLYYLTMVPLSLAMCWGLSWKAVMGAKGILITITVATGIEVLTNRTWHTDFTLKQVITVMNLSLTPLTLYTLNIGDLKQVTLAVLASIVLGVGIYLKTD